jgi:hypothetical protein
VFFFGRKGKRSLTGEDLKNGNEHSASAGRERKEIKTDAKKLCHEPKGRVFLWKNGRKGWYIFLRR